VFSTCREFEVGSEPALVHEDWFQDRSVSENKDSQGDTHGVAVDPRPSGVFWRRANKRRCSIRAKGVLGGLGGQETRVERVCGRYGMVGLGSEDTGGVALDRGGFCRMPWVHK